MSISQSLAELEQGFFKRLREDDTLSDLTTKIARGWPVEVLTNPAHTEFPRVSVFTPARRQLSDGPPYLEIQTDVWVWRSDDTGGIATLNAIDNAMLALLGDEDSAVTFAYTRNGVTDYMSAVCIDAGDPPEGAKLYRRRRLWQVAEA